MCFSFCSHRLTPSKPHLKATVNILRQASSTNLLPDSTAPLLQVNMAPLHRKDILELIPHKANTVLLRQDSMVRLHHNRAMEQPLQASSISRLQASSISRLQANMALPHHKDIMELTPRKANTELLHPRVSMEPLHLKVIMEHRPHKVNTELLHPRANLAHTRRRRASMAHHPRDTLHNRASLRLHYRRLVMALNRLPTLT